MKVMSIIAALIAAQTALAGQVAPHVIDANQAAQAGQDIVTPVDNYLKGVFTKTVNGHVIKGQYVIMATEGAVLAYGLPKALQYFFNRDSLMRIKSATDAYQSELATIESSVGDLRNQLQQVGANITDTDKTKINEEIKALESRKTTILKVELPAATKAPRRVDFVTRKVNGTLRIFTVADIGMHLIVLHAVDRNPGLSPVISLTVRGANGAVSPVVAGYRATVNGLDAAKNWVKDAAISAGAEISDAFESAKDQKVQ
jgi:hypothetical protein